MLVMSLSKKHLLKSALFLVLALLLIFLWLGRLSQSVPERIDASITERSNRSTETDIETKLQDSGSVRDKSAMSNKELEQAERESLLNTLPTSLQDIPLPENLEVDDNNELIINLKIRRLFDFYLSALGEEDLATLTQRIELNLTQQLPEPALTEALIILEGYLQYKEEIDFLRANSALMGTGKIEDIMQLKQSLRDSRSQFLSPEVAEAFFTQEDQYDDYQLQKTRILSDPALSSDARESALVNLKSSTPDWLLEQEARAKKISQYREQLQVLIDRDVSPAAISQLREQQFGLGAAERLNDLDQERAAWERRLTIYRKALLQGVQGLDVGSTDFIAVSESIRARHYTGHELIRIRALDAQYFAQ